MGGLFAVWRVDKTNERLSEKAQRAIDQALTEATSFGHTYVGTEHILLGLIKVEDLVVTNTFGSLGIDLNKVQTAIEFMVERRATIVGHICYDPRSVKVLDLADSEARRFGQGRIEPMHIVLALAREGGGLAAGVLESLGVNLDLLRDYLMIAYGEQLMRDRFNALE